MSDENAVHSQLLADSAADLLAISPPMCGMTHEPVPAMISTRDRRVRIHFR